MFQTVGSPGLWAGFIGLVFVLLAIDLGIFNRRDHEIKAKEALGLSFFWIALSLLFNALVWYRFGPTKGIEFFTGYVLEKTLSIDNIFVFVLLFSYFRVPKELQHRVLFWGILGAMIMRAAFILLGAALLERFHWIIYVFGLFLVVSGWKMLRKQSEEIHPENNFLLKWLRKVLPLTSEYKGHSFFVREDGRLKGTPLLLVLLVVEGTDVVFAVDSIPAIFGITRDPFIVFTSNIFAILGLRALYFLFASLVAKFRYLHVGLGGVLMFIGFEMLLAKYFKLSTGKSLLVIATLLGVAIAASLRKPKSVSDPDVSAQK